MRVTEIFFFNKIVITALVMGLMYSCGKSSNNQPELSQEMRNLNQIEKTLIEKYQYNFISSKHEYEFAFTDEYSELESAQKIRQEKEAIYGSLGCQDEFIKLAIQYIRQVDRYSGEQKIQESYKKQYVSKRNEIFIDLNILNSMIGDIKCESDKSNDELFTLLDQSDYNLSGLRLELLSAKQIGSVRNFLSGHLNH